MTVAHQPIRTCIGCRARQSWESLTRLVVQEAPSPYILVDTGHKSGGRGAWIHPTSQCWNKALKKNAFARAFRRPVRPTDVPREFSITESG